MKQVIITAMAALGLFWNNPVIAHESVHKRLWLEQVGNYDMAIAPFSIEIGTSELTTKTTVFVDPNKFANIVAYLKGSSEPAGNFPEGTLRVVSYEDGIATASYVIYPYRMLGMISMLLRNPDKCSNPSQKSQLQ